MLNPKDGIDTSKYTRDYKYEAKNMVSKIS